MQMIKNHKQSNSIPDDEVYPGNPEAMKYACQVAAEDVELPVQGIIQELGADGIFFSAQSGEVNRFTEEEYPEGHTCSKNRILMV